MGQKPQGSTSLSGSAEVVGNYSTNKWRLVGSTYAGLNYNKSVKNVFNPGLTTQISYYGANAAVVRRVKDLSEENKGQWDVALFLKDRNVQNNIDYEGDSSQLPENSLHNKARKTSIRAGVEWIAVPFLTETSKGNVAVRYSLSAERHQYVDPGTYEFVQETFSRHLAEVYLAKHYPKVDLNLGVGAFTTSFRKKPLQGLNGNAEISYKINPRTTFGITGSLQYAKNRVMNPAEGNSMSFTGLTAGSTPLTFTGSLSLSYTLGSIRIYNKEQRWKD